MEGEEKIKNTETLLQGGAQMDRLYASFSPGADTSCLGPKYPPIKWCGLAGGGVPIGNHPNFSEGLVLALLPVVLGKHFTELLLKFVGLLRG